MSVKRDWRPDEYGPNFTDLRCKCGHLIGAHGVKDARCFTESCKCEKYEGENG